MFLFLLPYLESVQTVVLCRFCLQCSRFRPRGHRDRLVVQVMYIQDKQVLVFNFVVDLLWTGRGSSVYLSFRVPWATIDLAVEE